MKRHGDAFREWLDGKGFRYSQLVGMVSFNDTQTIKRVYGRF